MKTIQQCLEMTRSARTAALIAEIGRLGKTQKQIAKLLFACEQKGDFNENESLNAFAQRVLGVELRRECQGVYEAFNVLRAIAAGKVVMTESQFDSIRNFAVTTISSLLSKGREKVPAAVAIALSGDKDVVNQLKELAGKKTKAGSTPAADPDAPIPGATEFFADLSEESPTYTIPTSIVALNHEELLKRIVSEVKGAGTIDDCDAFISIFDKLAAFAESRKETLEAECMQAARNVTVSKPRGGKDKSKDGAPQLPLVLDTAA